MSAPRYPLPRPETDPRYNNGFIFDMAKRIEAAGYPPITNGADLVRLKLALFGFLYETEEERGARTLGD